VKASELIDALAPIPAGADIVWENRCDGRLLTITGVATNVSVGDGKCWVAVLPLDPDEAAAESAELKGGFESCDLDREEEETMAVPYPHVTDVAALDALPGGAIIVVAPAGLNGRDVFVKADEGDGEAMAGRWWEAGATNSLTAEEVMAVAAGADVIVVFVPDGRVL
jgi:hypothetical protein